ELFRDIFGNPFRPATLNRTWQTATVMALTQAIYTDRAFDRLPILADALMKPAAPMPRFWATHAVQARTCAAGGSGICCWAGSRDDRARVACLHRADTGNGARALSRDRSQDATVHLRLLALACGILERHALPGRGRDRRTLRRRSGNHRRIVERP